VRPTKGSYSTIPRSINPLEPHAISRINVTAIESISLDRDTMSRRQHNLLWAGWPKPLLKPRALSQHQRINKGSHHE